MKISKDQFKHLSDTINEFLKTKDVPALCAAYENGNFIRSDKVKDLHQRFCIDVCYAAGLKRYVHDTVFTDGVGYNHLYTALKRIVPTVTRHYY